MQALTCGPWTAVRPAGSRSRAESHIKSESAAGFISVAIRDDHKHGHSGIHITTLTKSRPSEMTAQFIVGRKVHYPRAIYHRWPASLALRCSSSRRRDQGVGNFHSSHFHSFLLQTVEFFLVNHVRRIKVSSITSPKRTAHNQLPYMIATSPNQIFKAHIISFQVFCSRLTIYLLYALATITTRECNFGKNVSSFMRQGSRSTKYRQMIDFYAAT